MASQLLFTDRRTISYRLYSLGCILDESRRFSRVFLLAKLCILAGVFLPV